MFHLGVVVESLFDHVELAVLPRVVAQPGAVQPVAVVTAHVVVNLGNWKNYSNNKF